MGERARWSRKALERLLCKGDQLRLGKAVDVWKEPETGENDEASRRA